MGSSMLSKATLEELLGLDLISALIYDTDRPGITYRLISLMKTQAKREGGVIDQLYIDRKSIKDLLSKTDQCPQIPEYARVPDHLQTLVLFGIEVIETPPISSSLFLLPEGRTKFIVGRVCFQHCGPKFMLGAI